MRLYGLDQKSLWLDESISLARISHSFSSMLADVAINDGHPPVYYAFLYLMTLPFRAGGLGDGTLRYPSAVAGILTAWVVYRMERRLWPDRAFPAATALFAVSAFAVYYSQEARNYALVGLWIALSSHFLMRALEEESPSTTNFIGFVLSSTLALYTFYYALFFLVSQAAAVFAARKVSGHNALRWSLLFVVPLGLLALYVPVILALRERLAAAGAPLGFHLPDPKALALTLVEIAQGFNSMHNQWGWASLSLALTLALLPVLAAVMSVWPEGPRHRMLPILLAGPFLCLVVFPMKPHVLESKHLFPVVPVYFLLLAESFRTPARGVPGPGWRLYLRHSGRIAAAWVVLLNILSLFSSFNPSYVKEDWRTAASWLAREAGPRDIILPAPEYLQYPLRRYLPASRQSLVKALPELIEEGEGADFSPRMKPEWVEAPCLWLVELLDSPVSFEDSLAREMVARSRQAGPPRDFPGRLGRVRVSPFRGFFGTQDDE